MIFVKTNFVFAFIYTILNRIHVSEIGTDIVCPHRWTSKVNNKTFDVKSWKL